MRPECLPRRPAVAYVCLVRRGYYIPLKTYVLTTPKDANGQPLRMFKANLQNNVSKAINQLSGICSGILADGVVTEQEAAFFAEWIRKFAPFEGVALDLVNIFRDRG